MLVIGIIIGIILTLGVMAILARRYYVKNFKTVGVDLKELFGYDNYNEFNLKDSDFED